MPDLIPVNATVHYKTAFDIVLDTPEPMTYVRQIVRRWCDTKTQCADGLLHRRWFMTGNNPSTEPAHYLINGHQIRTATVPSDNPREPHCWVIEVIHGDAEEVHRRWAVEVVLKQIGTNRITFTTVVSNWLIPFFIGEYPPAPFPSVPRYVSDLIKDRTLQCIKGETSLMPRYSVVKGHHVQALYDSIKSEQRFVPYVVMSHLSRTGGPLLDPSRVATALMGSANTYVLDSDAANEEINFYLGKYYDIAPGSIRVFLPGLDKSVPHDFRRHRWLSESFVTERGDETIIRYLTNGLCRNASSFRLTDLTTFRDVLTERRRHRLAALARERETLSSQKQMTEADISLLWEEIETLNRTASEWEGTATQLQTELTSLRKENGTLSVRVTEAERVRSRIQDLTAQVDGLKSLGTLPTDLPEVLTTLSQLYPERVVVTEQAYATARRHSNDHPTFWLKLDGICTAWKMVHSLVTTLHYLAYDVTQPNLEDAYNSQVSEMTLALTETGSTRRDSSLMALRQLEWNDTSWDITPHLKYGTRNPKMLRLHFAFDRHRKRFIIGHCVDHLETSSTRSMS